MITYLYFFLGTKSDRLQTSTCSLAVFPRASEEDLIINSKDIKEEGMLASGAGGQNVQKNKTAVRLVHLPTGLSCKNQEQRTYEQNKAGAMAELRRMIYNAQFEEERASNSKARKSQIGNMDRNEKIRSYNFNRNAITDHRLGIVKQVPNIANFLEPF